MSTKPLASQVRYVEPLGEETTVQAKLDLVGKQADKAILSFPSLALAEAAAATLPDGQPLDVDSEQKRYRVEAGALVPVNIPVIASEYVGYDSGTAQDVLDSIKAMGSYSSLRNYKGRATGVRITQQGISGFFERDDADSVTADNGGTVIVDASERRWKRLFVGSIFARWFGAKPDYNPTSGTGTDSTIPISASVNEGMKYGLRVEFDGGSYRITDTISLLNSNYSKSFGLFGQNGNSTRIYFDNSVLLKNMFYVDSDVNYFELCDIELLDKNPRISRALYFFDTRSTANPAWKHLFKNIRITNFKEGVRFDGAADYIDDTHLSEVMFLHSKLRNCETGLIYNNNQSVNHQLIGFDMENDQEADGEEWTHIKLERGTTINHIGGSIIGKGSYLKYKYDRAGGFQNTSQFASKGIRVEKRGGASPIINQDVESILTVSNSLRIIIDDMPVITFSGASLFARFGGQTFAKFSNVHANFQMDVEAYMTSNLSSNAQYGSISLEDCKAINYKRVANVPAYGGTAVAANNFRSIPVEIRIKTEGSPGQNDASSYYTLNSQTQTIYSGGWQASSLKTLTYVNADSGGFGSAADPAQLLVNLPKFGRPCKFRLLRDDQTAAVPIVLSLYAVVGGVDYLLSSIAPTSGAGGHFEADLNMMTGLIYFINDGVNWDGKMKVIKTGTTSPYVGMIMIDYM